MTIRPEAMDDALPEEDPRLIAAYRGSSTEVPDPQTDAAIRAAARRAVGARPRTLGKPWQAPLALAATVVLSATVVYWTARDEGFEQPSKPVADGRTAAEKVVPAPPDEPVTLSSAAPAPAAKAEPQDRVARFSAAKQSAADAKADAPARRAPVARPAASPVPPAKEADLPSAPATMSESTVPEEVRIASEESRRDEQSEEERSMVQRARKGLVSRDTAILKQVAPGVRNMAGAHSAQAPTRIQSPEVSLEDPARWVEEIRQRLREGKRREALESLKDLRRAHPGYAIPEDLSELVKEISSTQP